VGWLGSTQCPYSKCKCPQNLRSRSFANLETASKLRYEEERCHEQERYQRLSQGLSHGDQRLDQRDQGFYEGCQGYQRLRLGRRHCRWAQSKARVPAKARWEPSRTNSELSKITFLRRMGWNALVAKFAMVVVDYPSLYPSIPPSIHRSIHRSIHPSTYLSLPLSLSQLTLDAGTLTLLCLGQEMPGFTVLLASPAALCGAIGTRRLV